jgi:exopolyphosphatase/guanosine-5'-triphosphate,3'-diphosphate pyrophosphatase
MSCERKCIVDVGSNSVLTLIAERQNGVWRQIFEDSKVTALGEGTKTTGQLGEKGIDATLNALKTAFDQADAHGAHARAFGTMALRIAQNADQFLALAKAQGTPVQPISEIEEADLSMRAVIEDPMFANNERITVVDIGGHSTEFATSSSSRTLFLKSLPIGTLSAREQFMCTESVTGVELLKASARIDDLLGFRFLPDSCGTVVVVGATGTNLITIQNRIVKWDPSKVHGECLTYEAVSRAVSDLCALNDRQRAGLVGIEPGRERTIHIGALILERALFALGAEQCLVSVRGWRYAMLNRI